MACAARWRCASRWRLQTVGGAPRTALPHGMLQVDTRCPHRDSSVDEKASVVFEVVFHRVVVRAEPSTRSEALAAKNKGELITAVRECAGWVLLKQRFHGREGWMLIDGRALGMGRLLQRVSALPSRRHALAFNAEHVTLRTGARMPLLGLGTGGVPGLEGEVAVRLVAHALRHCGVRLVDTASAYHNEEAVGKGIRQSGVPREEVFIITKVAPLEQGFDAAMASVRRSLKRMRLSYIDLVLVHWPGAWLPEQREWSMGKWIAEGPALARELRARTWQALEALHAEGVVRACGVSNYTPGHLLELLRQARTVLPAVLQSEHHPFFSNAEVRTICTQYGIAFQAYGPLSGSRAERAANRRGPENETVKRVAALAGCTPAGAMLKWAMQRGISVLPKSTRLAGIEENAGTNNFVLTEDCMSALDALDTGEPSYWDPTCVDSIDTYNIYLDYRGRFASSTSFEESRGHDDTLESLAH